MLPPIKYAHKSCPLPCDLHIQLDYNGSQLQNKKSIKKKKSVKRKKIVKRKKSVNRIEEYCGGNWECSGGRRM